jgi:two-component system, OmpR family, sensor histidine kinase CiaH
MFHSARIKLTAWYLLIITIVSMIFTVIIYSGINSELERFDHLQRLRQERMERRYRNVPRQFLPTYDPGVVSDARRRLILTLAFINLGILAFSGAAGYFLAGRTLRPIKEMVDEQNRFVSDASHELRTPLTSLRSEIEVYLRDKKLTLSQARKLLASNLEEVISLQQLSDNLLQLSRKTKTQHFEAIPVASFVEGAWNKVAPLANQKYIIFAKELPNLFVIGNEAMLTQLFVILFDNAIKYSPEKSTISVAAHKLDHTIRILIKDEGIGIAAADLPHIFDRFYRADKARTKHTSGYGLGLSIARKIVTEHKGSITAKNNKDHGTSFIIRLPSSS